MNANRFAPFAALAIALIAPFAEGAVKAKAVGFRPGVSVRTALVYDGALAPWRERVFYFAEILP